MRAWGRRALSSGALRAAAAGACDVDSAAVSALFEVKTQELALLKEHELKPRPDRCLTASGGV